MNNFVKINKIDKNNIPLIDFHIHTNWTDGKNTSLEMYNKAIHEGLESILFSEHVRKSSSNWFFKFVKEIRNLPPSSCLALVGIETKVDDFMGNLDSTDEIIEISDLVLASVHRFPGEKGIIKDTRGISPNDAVKIESDLSLAVLENKNVDILGHPFGMSYRRFKIEPSEEQFKQIIKKASKAGIAIEVNSFYHPNPWNLIHLCEEEGAYISLGSNAHDVSNVGNIIKILKETN